MEEWREILKDRLGISNDFAEATNHPYTCRCDKCREWWRKMGPDDDGYGPFTEEEINDTGAE